MGPKELIGTATAVVLLVSSIGGGYAWFDSRLDAMDAKHVQAAEYKDFQWSVMKEQINATRERMFKSGSAEERAHWERELRDLLDMFCRKYPDDRECRR